MITMKTDRFITKAATLLMLPLLLLLFTVAVSAQSSSAVTGVVTDSTGAVVPGVQVTLIDTKTSRELTTMTNDDGVYNFTNIPPGGGYRLSFTRQGFQTSVINDVQLGVARTETHNAQITAGDVSGTVVVTSTTGEETLNTTDASIGNVIGERQLRELPVQLRDNPAALIGLQPGVVGNNVGTGSTNRVGSVTGSRADQGNITVDGIDSNDVTTGQAFVTVGNLPIDSVQEFRAITTNPNASEGRSSGGQIQLATRTGSNDYHGTLREYYRGEKFASNSFFNNKNGIARPALQRHQFGGSLSGPLPFFNFGEGGPMFTSGKDRLFFFFDYEGRRDDSEVSVSRTVYRDHVRNGQIAYIIGSPACNALPIGSINHNSNPQCIGFLSVAQATALDPKKVGPNAALISFINERYPVANDLTGTGLNTALYRFNAPVTLKNNTYTTRIDANITDSQRLFSRLTLTRNDQTNAVQLFPGDEDSQKLLDKSYQFVVGHTWVITPSLTNQATVGVSRQKWDFPTADSPAFPTSFTFAIGQSPYSSMSFQNRDVIVPTIRDDVTWIKGSHSFQFGGSYKPIQQRSTLINDFNFATIGLGGLTTALNAGLRPANLRPQTAARQSYDAAFAFILGRIATLDTNFVYDVEGNPQEPGTGKKRNYVYNEYELYAQDNWKIRSDLTINLGLRWHFYPPPYEKNGFQAGNDVDFQQLLDTRVQNGLNGISGLDAAPLLTYDLIGKENGGRSMYKSDTNNFAPRVGFAYNPSFKGGLLGAIFGDRKMVIRGGFSMVYDRVGGALSFIQDQLSFIFDNQASTSFGNASATTALLNDPRFTGIGSLPVANTPPAITRPFTPDPFGQASSNFNYAIAQNFEIPHSYQWSFGIQRELPGNLLLDVSYVGRKARKLFAQSDAAQIVDFKDVTSGQFMLDAFNQVQTQLQAGTPLAGIVAQPWIENQLAPQVAANYANFGGTCKSIAAAFFGVVANNCTQFVAAFQPALLEQGGTADLVHALFANSLLAENVGLSSQFAVNAYITNQGYSDYNGMLVSLQKRYSQGFQFDINYTWSHAIDNQSSVTNAVTEGLIFDALNPDLGRADADFDIRHLFNANVIWDLPIGRGRAFGGDMPKWLDAVIGGWTISSIFTARSGLPFSVYSGAWSRTFFTADNAGVPAILSGDISALKVNIHTNESGAIQYFADPVAAEAALRFPRHGEVSGGRNAFRSQGFWNIDMAISKKFQMPWSENHRLTFRAEAYNLFNKNFFGLPSRVLENSNFGEITGSQSTPRVLQFALRYDF